MISKKGLLNTLGAIAIGIATASTTPAAAQTVDLDAFCAAITQTATLAEFEANADAMSALRDTANPCHLIAAAHYATLRLASISGNGTLATPVGYSGQ